jgi:hypothetical protein
MTTQDLLLDGYGRIKEVVHHAVEGLNADDLAFRPSLTANSIAWLVWHLARVQDDHIADAAGQRQVWEDGWADRFGLPFAKDATGYGHTSQEVAGVKADAAILLGYYDAVHEATVKYVGGLQSTDYDKVVDEGWEPPVTLGVRLISVLSDDLQHAGQAAYIRGLLKERVNK